MIQTLETWLAFAAGVVAAIIAGVTAAMPTLIYLRTQLLAIKAKVDEMHQVTTASNQTDMEPHDLPKSLTSSTANDPRGKI